MGRIRGSNTKPELIVRSLLHRMGFRFRVNRRDLPGTPDVVLPKYSAVVFVHGCFWHRHENCPYAYIPKSRKKFWKHKFDATIERDRSNYSKLEEAGWTVHILWECDILRDPIGTIKSLAVELLDCSPASYQYPLPDKQSVLRVAEEKLKSILDG